MKNESGVGDDSTVIEVKSSASCLTFPLYGLHYFSSPNF